MFAKLSFMCAALMLFTTAAVHAADTPKVGQKAPDFTLTSADGKTVSLADYRGKVVVLEWTNPECPFVQRHYKAGTMKKLADEYAAKGVTWLAINTTSSAKPEAMQQWAKANNLDYPILMDNSGEVGKSYGAKTTPHMFIIDTQGTIAYAGGIDDDPAGEKANRVNFVSNALDQVLAGKEVSQSETRPYGCSVKYGK